MINFSDIENASWQCVHYALPGHMEELHTHLSSSPYAIMTCDAAAIKDDKALFDSISKAMNFPDYFGRNWDALNDCISDMAWQPADGYVLVLNNAKTVWRDAPYTAGKLVSIWQVAAEFWYNNKIPFHLVFVL